MSAEFFRSMAARCRALMNRTRTEAARAQLRIWVVEFEEQAASADLAKQTAGDA